MSKKVIQKVFLTIISLIISNYLMIFLFDIYRKSDMGNFYSDLTQFFSPIGSPESLFLLLIIFVNVSIVIIGSVSITKSWYNIKKFPKSKTTPSKSLTNRRLINPDLINSLNIIPKEFKSNVIPQYKLTAISEGFLRKIDEFQWKDDEEKLQFINEMLSLTPSEREEILDYMREKLEN